MNIIGISAKKQGGKTTALRGLLTPLQAAGEHIEVVSFADALKTLVIDYLLQRDEDVILPSDLDPEEVKTRVHPCGKTYRELLQIVGTDWFRALWPEVWVENYAARLLTLRQDSVVLTPDVRFPNEVACVQRLGGHVLRLLRAPFSSSDQHASETALDSYTGFDAVLDNSQLSIPEQHEAVWQIVVSKKWVS